MAPAPLTPAEASFFPSLFTKFQKNGSINGQSAFELLPLSDVPLPVLGEIWGIADPQDKGALDVAGWTVAMRLISVAQRGGDVTPDAGEQPSTQLPKFRGHPPPPPSILRTPQPQSSYNPASSLNPPLTPEDLAKFKKHFQLAGPVNGRLPSDKAYSIFVKSKLPASQLGAIWNLADTQDRGALDQPDFIIGMYFIQGVMSQKIKNLPQTLPHGLYEAASEGRSLPVSSFDQDLRSLSLSPAPISQQNTGAGFPPPSAPISRQVTGQQQQQPILPISRNVTGSHQMLPNVTGGSYTNQNNSSFAPPSRQQSGFAPTPAPEAQPLWDVTDAEKVASDKFFDTLDTTKRGILDGNQAVPFMLESKLPEVDLASIWDLADIRKEGQLTRDEFAVAMYLIRSKLSGKALPESLPASLVPPSLRQQNAAPPALERDLFDAFGDSPPASASAATNYFATPVTPQARAAPTSPPSSAFNNVDSGFGMTPFGVPSTAEEDLFGDETPFTPFTPPAATSAAPAPPSVHARSPPPPPPPELTKLRTENLTLSRSVSQLQSSGLTLENQTLETAKEIMDLQAKLVSLRATHESEKGNVDKLRAKAEEQAAKLKELRSETIRAESELSGLRGEKTELDGQVMRDKEDIREMKRRMVEVAEETTQLKAQVEKLKKDARQQKGLLAITKKQVGTVEAEKLKTVVAYGDAEQGVGLEEESGSPASASSPFASFTPSGASAFSAQVASHYPLPETPERMLSPALSVASQKSNNPFDRFVASTPPAPTPASPAAPIKELASPTPSSEAVSPVTHVKELAVGGIAAAGTALASVGLAIFGGSKSENTEEEDKEKKVEGAEPKPPQSSVASTFDDSFGASPPSSQTPFAPAPSNDDATKAFDAGFGDSFDDGFEPTPTSFPAGETAPGPASPSDVPFASRGFDSTFGDKFPPAKTEEKETVEEPTVITHSIDPETSTLHAEPAAVASAFDTAPSSPAPAPAASFSHDTDEIEENDSSDDEDEGPEDLEGGKKPFESKAKPVEPEDAAGSQFPDLDDPTSEPSSNLTSTASAFGTDDSVPPSASSHPFDDAFEPTPPTTVVSPTAESSSRRPPPPPPPSRGSVSNAPPAIPTSTTDAFGASPFKSSPFDLTPNKTQQSPFETSPFGAEDVTTSSSPLAPTPSDTAVAPPLQTFDAPKTGSSSNPAVESFDDFDQDFDDVPAAQDISHQQGTAPKAAPQSTVSPIAGGFDDFDDFSTDFDPVPSSTAPPPPASSSAPAYDVDPSFADFDSAFGETPTSRPAAPANTFSFDDAFGDEPTPAPQETYAPPPGPPPAFEAPTTPSRPALPTRKTQAEPDDIPDVKSIVGMGFSRSEALNALEIGDYNLQKAIDHLVSK